MSLSSISESLIQKIGGIPDFIMRLGTNYKTKSLIDVTRVARVEPLTVISRDLIHLEYINEVLQSALSIFSGYYLQAISLSTQINNVKVVRILDRLNPDRHFNDLMITAESFYKEPAITLNMLGHYKENLNISAESYKYRLPTSKNTRAVENEIKRLNNKSRASTEFISIPEEVNDGDVDTTPNGITVRDKTVIQANEVVNLSVGKLLNVEIKVGEDCVTIPVTTRLATATLPNSSILHLLSLKKEDNTLTERFHAWRAGRIELIRDLIFCQDLIDTHKRALMDDESGVYSEIIKRVNNSKKYGILSNNPSLVSASNIFVLSEEVAKELEHVMGGKLANPRVRNLVFENTYAMLIIVIDREYERVTFYTRDVSASTDVSIKEIKASNKNKGPEIGDILKSILAGNAPTF